MGKSRNISPFHSSFRCNGRIKKDNHNQALPFLNALENEFTAISSRNSEAGQAASSALRFAKSTPNNDTFELLSKALLAFEKEQNPVDYTLKREQFAKRITPVYQKLLVAVQNQQLDDIQTAYNRFNNTWTLNEKVVRETSIGHYGKIETAMTLLRVAMLYRFLQFLGRNFSSTHLFIDDPNFC